VGKWIGEQSLRLSSETRPWKFSYSTVCGEVTTTKRKCRIAKGNRGSWSQIPEMLMGSLFLRLSGLLADFDLLDGHVWIELCRFQNRLRQFLKSNFTFDQNCTAYRVVINWIFRMNCHAMLDMSLKETRYFSSCLTSNTSTIPSFSVL